MKTLNPLTAVSPIDGRYSSKVETLRLIFSEYGLIQRRVSVEIAWLKALCACPDIPEARELSDSESAAIQSIADDLTLKDAERVKEIEQTTNHDVKAVEYFIKEKFAGTSYESLGEFVHFGCTSEDINNVSHALMLKDGLVELRRRQEELTDILADFAIAAKDTAMLARTHGQPASPTTLGKEMAVFVHRLRRQAEQIDAIVMPAKLNGAVGNFNAHFSAYPDVDWQELSRAVIEGVFSLKQTPLTTQIESHDGMAELFDAIARWNTVLTDLNRDIWAYISLGYLGQKTKQGEIGSSTMPHKVNPIDFENSEGNLGLGNAVFDHLARKLPVSRLQRDLTDSTVLRNMGVGFGYSLIAYASTVKGLGKIRINAARLKEDLNKAWEVLAEPIQTVMRKLSKKNPYEQLKELTRGEKVNAQTMRKFVDSLDIPEEDRSRLRDLTPETYIGIAPQLAEKIRRG
ncbi:MAG: adenylosuccinate lyase [Kiritimatiellia bacterium]